MARGINTFGAKANRVLFIFPATAASRYRELREDVANFACFTNSSNPVRSLCSFLHFRCALRHFEQKRSTATSKHRNYPSPRLLFGKRGTWNADSTCCSSSIARVLSSDQIGACKRPDDHPSGFAIKTSKLKRKRQNTFPKGTTICIHPLVHVEFMQGQKVNSFRQTIISFLTRVKK